MDAIAVIKVLFMSFAMVGLARLLVVAFIGDAQNRPAIGEWMHAMKRRL